LAFGIANAQDKLEFKASGFIDAQTMWSKNTPDANAGAGIYGVVPAVNQFGGNAYNRITSYLESRCRLKFDAVMSKSLSGTLLFEFDAEPWGNPPGGNTGKISDRGAFGYWGGDRAALEVKNIYIDWGVPSIPVPVSVRVGLQTLAIRPNLFLLTDGMAVNTSVNLDPVSLQMFWAKAVEGKYEAADDSDVYGIHAKAKVGTMSVGGYGVYYNMNSFPLWNPAPTAGTQRSDMFWFGVYADGKAGPVDLNFDFIYDWGWVKRPGFQVYPKVKYSGWETRIKISFPWEMFDVGAIGMYATGADRYKTSGSGTAGSATAIGTESTKVASFVVPPASEASGAFGEAVVLLGSWVNRGNTGWGTTYNYSSMTRGPAGGLWFGKLYAAVKPTPWYKATFQVLYVGDTTKHGNTFGTAWKYPVAFGGLGIRRDDKEVGWEFDLIHEIAIYKNLKYNIGMGYVFAGKGMEFGYTDPVSGFLVNNKPKNPWNVLTSLVYTF